MSGQRRRPRTMSTPARGWLVVCAGGGAGLVLGVLQSANRWGRPVTLFACTFAPGAQAEGTMGEFFRKMARPARIRTCDPRLRRPMLYPAELRARAE